MTATVKGRDAQIGQTVKDSGRWYQLAELIENPLFADRDLRVFDATDARGETKRVVLFDDDVYPLRGADKAPAATVITIADFLDHSNDFTVEIAYRKRSYGGWEVVRADNGRRLGWLCKDDEGWSAYVSSDAFRGDSADDRGESLDEVPLYLFGGQCQVVSDRIAFEATRDDAAGQIVRRLHKYSAPALGFGRRYDVRRWADR
jgi:hypothetical protein